MKLIPHDVAIIAEELCAGFEANILQPPPLEAVAFEDAVKAYERIASGKASAKQVLTFF
jgi:hypothetical protein